MFQCSFSSFWFYACERSGLLTIYVVCLFAQMASSLVLVFLTALPGVLCYQSSFIDLEAKGSELALMHVRCWKNLSVVLNININDGCLLPF